MSRHTAHDLERKSSAVTLSDMEVFVFPELIYSLLIANLMSPRIWKWRDDPWFDGLNKMTTYRRITRVKQFIMDRYAFNLDLDTWGLTTTEREMARFRDFISPETLAQSNALFGYEGDKYYFDIDIRRHFGLDKYNSNVIPYWKTETVEAMDAFRHRPNYTTGAGECVSLSALYAAALIIVAGIAPADLYMLATPLHSQNFVDSGDGILTNNRRLVTKNMWFNGTALSAQARRALENERVTIVAHETGVIHILYNEATIGQAAYRRFSERLRHFLRASLTEEILGNFIRHADTLQRCFQVRWPLHGKDHYIAVEDAFSYEKDSSFRLTDKTREKLMAEIDTAQLQPVPIPKRIVLNDLEDFIRTHKITMDKPEDVARLKQQFACDCLSAEMAIESLCRFCRTEPKLPDAKAKTFVPAGEPLGLAAGMTRDDIIGRMEAIRDRNAIADLAFYAYRDLNRTAPEPFLKAAVERSPVSIAACATLKDHEAVGRVFSLADESIYDEPGRLAQPDEAWNFGRGDGVEKAVLLANILRARRPDEPIRILVSPDRALVRAGAAEYRFDSRKQVKEAVWEIPVAADFFRSLPP